MTSQLQEHIRHLQLCVYILLGLIVVGAVGLRVTGEHSWFDAVYLTTIILTTVGMEAATDGEKPIALFLMLGGIFTTIYAAGNVVAFLASGEATLYLNHKRLMRMIQKLNGHYIVVGYGRMGRALCAALREKHQPFVLIEFQEEKALLAEENGILVIRGNAMEEEVYHEARIEHASGLAACLPKDADNVFVTLTARELSQNLNIISRTEDPETHSKLIRAGADRVVCPPVLSASKVMAMLTTPVVDHGAHADIMDVSTEIEMHKIPVDQLPLLLDKPLAENHVRTRTGMTVVAVDREAKRDFNPTALFSPKRGDVLTVVGPQGGLQKMKDFYGKR